MKNPNNRSDECPDAIPASFPDTDLSRSFLAVQSGLQGSLGRARDSLEVGDTLIEIYVLSRNDYVGFARRDLGKSG